MQRRLHAGRDLQVGAARRAGCQILHGISRQVATGQLALDEPKVCQNQGQVLLLISAAD